MYAITSEEINEDYDYAWDCLVEAVYNDPELYEILGKYKGRKVNKIQMVTALVNHFFSEEAIRLVSMWGFGDTPAKDQMYLDIKAKKDQLKPYLLKYSE